MAIKSIEIKNFKGNTTSQKLTGKDLIIGPNGSGKSTRIQALGTALLGYVPGANKSPQETFRKSSDDREMAVGLTTDNFSFERKFERKERTKKTTGETEISFSETLQISPSKGERTNTQKKARVEQELGNFPIMLDFSEFLNLTNSKRRDFMYSLSNQSSVWDRPKLYAYLEDALLTPEIEVQNPEYYDELKVMINLAMDQYPSQFEFEDGLNAMIAWSSDELKYWKKKAKDSEGAIRQFAELKNRSKETDRNARANKEELSTLRNRLMEIKEQLAKDTEKKKAIDKKNAAKEKLNQEIKQLEEMEIQSADALHIKIKELTASLKEVPESKAAEYEAKATEADRLKEEARNASWLAKKEYQKLESQRDAIQHNINTINDNKGVCVIHAQIACNKDFTAYLQHAESQMNTLQERINQFEEEGTNKQKESEQHGKEAQEWRKKAQDDNNKFREIVNHNQQVERQIQQVKDEIAAIQKSVEQWKDKLAKAKESLQELESEPMEVIAPLDILEKQRDNIQMNIEELEEKVKEQEKLKTQLATMKQTMIEAKKAGYKVEALKAVQKALGTSGVQGEIVKELIEPIRADVDANLKLMGVPHKAFFQTESEKGQDIFQFGWIKDGSLRDFDSLSTGEQLMFLIAFLVTILERANPPLKVLALDNIENLDESNFRRVLEGLGKISDKLDNILLAGVVDPVEVEGWTVTNLSQMDGELHESA